MTAPIKHCPQPDPPELVMRADGYHYRSEDEMARELTDAQIDDLGFTARIHLAAPGTGKQAEAARKLVRAAIAAHVVLNAADRDVMRQAEVRNAI